ncbi:hypothetical protein [Aminipila sp.]|uniref:hypothetical protein n=1 Tax=Aminipila sp. TaxID=2060095 RepID=UPI0028A22CF2|nr:hypothetical protein [Aminipila sp.]
MKIESSVIAMNSARNYESIEFTKIKSEDTKWVQAKPENKQNNQDKINPEDDLTKFVSGAKKLLADETQIKAGSPVVNQTLSVKTGGAQDPSISPSELEDNQLSLLKLMLGMLLKHKHESNYRYSGLTEQSQMTIQSLSISFGGVQTPPVAGTWVRNVNATHFLSEEESTTFSSVGVAKTQDGRQLSFGIDLEMSRNFMEYTNLKWSEQVVMTDPLVINLNSNSTSLSDQKFCFDIDSDGKENSISFLNKGSGYLALDKNQDGKINNGNELFGAKTGNGFSELAAYDYDKNGWIDENDEIYNKLKVWIKTEEGTDKLIDFKAADIGAIYLGSNQTDFILKSTETGQINGQIRRTGLYLKESTGLAETVQQIDVSI